MSDFVQGGIAFFVFLPLFGTGTVQVLYWYCTGEFLLTNQLLTNQIKTTVLYRDKNQKSKKVIHFGDSCQAGIEPLKNMAFHLLFGASCPKTMVYSAPWCT